MAIFITSYKSEGLVQALSKIGAFDVKAREAAEKAMRNGTRRIAASARRRVAVKSGTLKSKISGSFKADKMTGYVRAKAPHAHLVEFGAKGTVVFPKKAKALKIPVTEDTWAVDKKAKERGFIYAKKAVIPARSPHPFMIPAFEEQEPRIVADVKKGIESVKVT